MIAFVIIFALSFYHSQNKKPYIWHQHDDVFLENEQMIAVSTYNIQFGKGQDKLVNLERTIKTLQSLDANIISLQEVERNSLRSNFSDQVKIIANELDMNVYFSPSLTYPGLYYGNAVLTRFPIKEAKTIHFNHKLENRAALIVEVQVSDDQSIHVINTHLGLDRDERSSAIDKINQKLTKLDGPIILTGDLNSVPSQQEYRKWDDKVTKSNKGIPIQTYNSRNWQIDYIFHSSDFTVNEVNVIESDASDHFPVSALLYFDGLSTLSNAEAH
jgi:endonuclease/exonuclease/phosphatase family metal-dependent hydrolase